MRLIPVMDLQNGLAVHAVRGVRQNYLPVRSGLCATAAPVDLARAFRDRLGLTEIYIADLDAIQGCPRPEHRTMIRTLARREGLGVWLDRGAQDAAGVQDALDLGVQRVIVGAETLPDWDALKALPAAFPGERLIFSLDMRAGKIFSRCPELAALAPLDALQAVQAAGWKQVILLDLARVGSGEGVDWALIAGARAQFPGLELIAGGGIARADDLQRLIALGAAGALAASALHSGVITLQHLVELGLTHRSSPA